MRKKAWKTHASSPTVDKLQEQILKFRLCHRLTTENERMLTLAEAYLVKAEVPQTHTVVGKTLHVLRWSSTCCRTSKDASYKCCAIGNGIVRLWSSHFPFTNGKRS